MKRIANIVLISVLKLLPFAARRTICRLLFSATSRADANTALRELFHLQDDLEAYIDECAIRLGAGVHPKMRILGYPEFFADRVRPGERVLDVGCGFGLVSFRMAEAGAIVTGIDLDERQIERARRSCLHPNVKFITGDATVVLPREVFDVVVLSNVLEHLSDRVAFLLALARRNRPGRLLLRVPMLNRSWQTDLRRELGLFYYTDPTHFIEYSPESLADELRSAGFEVKYHKVAYSEIWAEAAPFSS